MTLNEFINQTEIDNTNVILLFESDIDLRVIPNCKGNTEFEVKYDAYQTYLEMQEIIKI